MKRRLLCSFLIALAAAEWLFFASTSTKSATPGGDFVIVYAGAKLANENPLALYDSQAQFRIEQEALHSEGYEARFLYPPFFALAIRPLGRINYAAAYWVWTTFTIVVYLAAVLLLIREFLGNAAIIVLSAIACPAFHWLMVSGQTTALALLIFVLIYIAVTRRLYFIAGALIALLAYRPQFMILLAPICLVRLPRSAIFGFIILLFGLFLIGAIGLSLDSYLRYWALIREMTDLVRLKIHPLGFFISAYVLLRTLGSEMLATTGSLGLAIFLGYRLFRHWPRNDNTHRFASWFASAIIGTLLAMSYSLIYDLLLIIPVIAFTFGVAPRGAKAFVLAVLYCAPIVYFFLGSSAINLTPIALAWLFVVIDRALAESCGAVLAVKAQQKMSST
jgi:hypothetical protein